MKIYVRVQNGGKFTLMCDRRGIIWNHQTEDLEIWTDSSRSTKSDLFWEGASNDDLPLYENVDIQNGSTLRLVLRNHLVRVNQLVNPLPLEERKVYKTCKYL